MSKWKIEYDLPEVSEDLSGYNPLLAAVLSLRGYTTADSAGAFICPSDKCVGNPFMLKGMAEAVSRINNAIARKENVAVFGDYDVDGITATCIVTDYLRRKGLHVRPYIPNRNEEGYGLNRDALDILKAEGNTLVITVDCGITAFCESRHALETGLDLIITDHHECKQDELPDCCIVIDPKQPGDSYPFKELAGVGVAFKLICGIDGKDISDVMKRYCDLIAIGTVADVMPLVGENRYFVREGLASLNNRPRHGIAAMLGEQEEWKDFDSSRIGFFLAPRLNAAGRMDRAIRAFDLLMSETFNEARKISEELIELNRMRQEEENKIWRDAEAKLNSLGADLNSPIVLSGEEWHQGVIGIAASRLAEKFRVPAIMIHLKDGRGKGSCRSYGGFNIFDALAQCSDCLETYGGHAAAAGLNILEENIEVFRDKLSECYVNYLNSGISDNYDMVCDLLIDNPSVLSVNNVNELWGKLAPFGNGNQEPVFCISNAVIDSSQAVGSDRKHLKMTVAAGNEKFDCIYFSHGSELGNLSRNKRIDLAFIPKVNSFRGKENVQLIVKDAREHQGDELCSVIKSGSYTRRTALGSYRPVRSDFVQVWKNIKNGCPPGMDCEKYVICLKVFEQAGLIDSVENPRPVDGAKWSDLNATSFMKTFGWVIKNDKR